jgi:S-formylglutathione hydrolase FrmB
MIRKILPTFLVALFIPAVIFAQPASRATPTSADHKLKSALMRRELPYRVVLPAGYSAQANVERRYPVIYLLHGLAGHYDNWTDKTGFEELPEAEHFIIVTPEGGDGWYTDSLSAPDDKYESYIVKELIPEIDKKFRTIPARAGRVIAGLSMGGYGSMKFGLRYSQMFSLVGSFSGAIDAPLRGEQHKFYRPSIMVVFGAADSQIRKDNDVFRMVREMSAEGLKALPFIYLDCGTEDVVNISLNRDFATLLFERKVPHEFRQLPGAHNWVYWDRQIREFLRLSDRLVATR